MDDVDAESFSDASDTVDAYQKNGFSDYYMISPDEIEALMASADLRTKTGTLIGSNYWTDEIDIAELDAKAWVGDAGSVEVVPVETLLYCIPVRRVEVV